MVKSEVTVYFERVGRVLEFHSTCTNSQPQLMVS